MKGKGKEHDQSSLVKTIIDNLFSLFKICVICFVVVFTITNYLIRPLWVSGDSMHPTIKDGEFLIGNSFAAHFSQIKRGDIVVAYEALYTKTNMIKRVIALPGETITCQHQKIYIDGVELEEPYLDNYWKKLLEESNQIFNEDFKEVTLKENEYFLLGDNRYNSLDSIEYGPFKKNQIKAVGIYRFLPFNKLGEKIE